MRLSLLSQLVGRVCTAPLMFEAQAVHVTPEGLARHICRQHICAVPLTLHFAYFDVSFRLPLLDP